MGMLDKITGFSKKPPRRNTALVPMGDERDYEFKGAKEDFARAAWGENQGGANLSDGYRYHEHYKSFTWVNVCMNAIAHNAATVPLRAIKVKNDSTTEDLPANHELSQLIEQPTPQLTQEEWIERSFLNLEGTGLNFVLMDEESNPPAMYLPKPHKITIHPSPYDGIDHYDYEVNGRPVHYDTEQMWYHRYQDPTNDFLGLPPLTAARRSLLSEDRIIEWNNRFFENHCRVDMILRTDQHLEKDARRRLLTEFMGMFRGFKNAFKTAVLDAGTSIDPLNLPPKDVEFVVQRRLNRWEILAIFGVTPIMVGIVEDAMRATAEEQKRIFWQQTMLPKLRRFAKALTLNVARRYGKDYALVFDTTEVEALQENYDQKAARLKVLRDAGGLSANQILDAMGYETFDSPIMNAVLVPAGYMLVDPVTGVDVTPVSNAARAQLESQTQLLQMQQQGQQQAQMMMQHGQGQQMMEEEEPEEDEEEEKSAGAPEISKSFKRYIASSHDRALKRFSRDYKRVLGDLFERQGERVAKRFETLNGTGKKALNVDVDFDPFEDDSFEIDEFVKDLRPIYTAALIEAGAARLDQLTRGSPEFGEATQRVLNFLDSEAAKNITRVTAETKTIVREVLKDAFTRGDSIDTIAQELRATFKGFSDKAVAGSRFTRADVIARTEVNQSLNVGNHEGEAQAVEMGAQLLKSWIALPDDRVRESHEQVSAETISNPIPWDQPFSNGLMYPHAPNAPAGEVVNCFLPGTSVSGRVLAGSKAWYSGTAWEIKTARGHRLRVTANHPVLTTKGWVAAHELCEGDHLLTDRLPVAAGVKRNVDHQDSPSLIENVFDSMASDAAVGLSVVRALDFHGDARSIVGKVEIVRATGNLSPCMEASKEQAAVHVGHALPRSPMLSEIMTHGAPNKLGSRSLLSSAPAPCGGTLTLDRSAVDLEPAPLQPLSIGRAAHWHTTLGEPSKDAHARVADFIGELLRSSSGAVAPDQIVHVRAFAYSGHVYDLQCDDGWILADGIIASNCRCTSVSIPLVLGANALQPA